MCVRVFDVGREGVGLVMFDYLCWNNMKSYHTIRKRRIYWGCVPRCENSSNSDTIRSEYRGLHICEKQRLSKRDSWQIRDGKLKIDVCWCVNHLWHYDKRCAMITRNPSTQLTFMPRHTRPGHIFPKVNKIWFDLCFPDVWLYSLLWAIQLRVYDRKGFCINK